MTWGKKFSFAKGSSQRGTQLRGTLQKAKGWSTLVQKRELSWGLAASISTSSCAHWLLGDPLLWITYTLIYQIHFLLGYGSVFFIFLLSCRSSLYIFKKSPLSDLWNIKTYWLFTLHGVFEEDLCVALISVPSFSVQICVTSMNKSVCLGIYQWMFGLFPLVVYYDEGCDDHSCTRLLWTDIFISLGYKSCGKTVGSYGNWHGKLSNCFSKVVTSIYSHPGNAGGHQCTNFSTFLQTFAIFFLKIIAILVDTE